MRPAFEKPTIEEVYAFLRQKSALIVHFSGTPKGGGSDFDFLYPDDLKNVIALQAPGGVSCSTVMPGDEFADLGRANATGCIGTVLGFQSRDSLVSVDPHDCGSYVENGVRLVPNERDLTVAISLRRSRNGRQVATTSGSYGTTRCSVFLPRRHYTFRSGKFRTIRLKRSRFLDHPTVSGFQADDIVAVRTTFPALPIFTFHGGQICSSRRAALLLSIMPRSTSSGLPAHHQSRPHLLLFLTGVAPGIGEGDGGSIRSRHVGVRFPTRNRIDCGGTFVPKT